MLKEAIAALVILVLSPGAGVAEPAGSDVTSISQLLLGMFDKPNEPLTVGPVSVSGDHAVAGWIQGQTGGRALLRRRQASWVVVLCAGDAIRSREALLKAGVPAADALKLEAEISVAEAKVPPETIAMFSRFEGLVMMNAAADHANGPAGLRR